jgi:hypothetical protein
MSGAACMAGVHLRTTAATRCLQISVIIAIRLTSSDHVGKRSGPSSIALVGRELLVYGGSNDLTRSYTGVRNYNH